MLFRSDSLRYRPLCSETVSQKRLEVAHLRYLDARAGRDIAVSCYLESSETWIVNLWKWNEGFWNKFLVKVFLTVHIIMTFFEPASQSELQSSGMPLGCFLIDLLCLAVEVQDAVAKTILSYHSLPIREKTVENIRHRLLITIILDVVLFLVFLDAIFSVSIPFSYEFYIPLKVFIIYLEVVEVR